MNNVGRAVQAQERTVPKSVPLEESEAVWVSLLGKAFIGDIVKQLSLKRVLEADKVWTQCFPPFWSSIFSLH